MHKLFNIFMKYILLIIKLIKRLLQLKIENLNIIMMHAQII